MAEAALPAGDTFPQNPAGTLTLMTLFQVILLAIVQGLPNFSRIISSRGRGRKTDGARPIFTADDPASGHAPHRNHVRGNCLFLEILEDDVFFQQRCVQAVSGPACVGHAAYRRCWRSAKKIIERTYFHGAPKAQIEMLFSHLELIAPALAAAGVLILVAGMLEHRKPVAGESLSDSSSRRSQPGLNFRQAGWMGIVQGLALPFRGFSRSGSTISVGMLTGARKEPAEQFSFALAVVLTPPVVIMEAVRLVHAASGAPIDLHASIAMSLLGAVFSFIAGLLALKWLSSWLEAGRWHWFGVYCLVASAIVFVLHARGF